MLFKNLFFSHFHWKGKVFLGVCVCTRREIFLGRRGKGGQNLRAILFFSLAWVLILVVYRFLLHEEVVTAWRSDASLVSVKKAMCFVWLQCPFTATCCSGIATSWMMLEMSSSLQISSLCLEYYSSSTLVGSKHKYVNLSCTEVFCANEQFCALVGHLTETSNLL